MGYSQVNEDLKKKIKLLTFSYSNKPQSELLVVVPNPHPDLEYEEKLVYPEFTSLCPLAPTQPDYATLIIKYIPDEYIVELKSLKFYLVAYRQVEIFHEAVVGQILKDIVEAVKPRRAQVKGQFTTRGGIQTNIFASYKKNGRE